jgi:hypothetical protein
MGAEMTEPRCYYLQCVKTAFRANLDLSPAAPVHVSATWYCRHPFHGIHLEIGDARADVERHCAGCTLPRPQPCGDAR